MIATLRTLCILTTNCAEAVALAQLSAIDGDMAEAVSAYGAFIAAHAALNREVDAWRDAVHAERHRRDALA